jgi:hypothetical protein
MAKKDRSTKAQPRVELFISPQHQVSAAAGGLGDGKLSHEQISAIQTTVNQVIIGFVPPAPAKSQEGGFSLREFELEVGFSLEAGTGHILKLFLDGKAGASITAKAVWKVAP